MQIVESRKLLVFTPTDVDEVMKFIPHARALNHNGETLLAVNHGVEETMVLRNMGLREAPAPILSYYDFPARFKAMTHQKETSAFLTSNRGALCLNAPGTGKSLSALWAADYLLQEGTIKKILIVAPLSTLKPVWGTEIMHHLPHLGFTILSGDKKRKLRQMETPQQIYIINHDGFTSMAAHLNDFDLVIYDEATAVKTPGSQRFRIFQKWVLQHNPWLWLMTGTPISQSPTDAWTISRLIGSPFVPRSYTQFRDMVMNKVTTFKWVPRPEALDICKRVMQPSIRYSLEECRDMPETSYIGRQCELSPQQKQAFKDMEETAVAVFKDGTVLAANAAVMLGKLVQITCIAENTPVLTRAGWKPIEAITAKDSLWDGVEWVSCSGSVCSGYKPVLSCGGVLMTPDHRVLAERGWTQAKEIDGGKSGEGFNRAEVWLPDGYSAGGYDAGDGSAMRSVAVPLPVRGGGGQAKPVSSDETSHTPTKLRVSSRQRHTQSLHYPPVPNLDAHAAALPLRNFQGLEELRCAGDNSVRRVALWVQQLLERHAAGLREFAHTWALGQRRPVLQAELPLGNSYAASEQQAQQCADTYSTGATNGIGGRESVWTKVNNDPQAHGAGEHGLASEGAVAVYDILNCGPRSRFVVRGAGGELSIVHNCGVVYGANGEVIRISSNERLDSLVELLTELGVFQGEKVIVYVPLRGVQTWLQEALSAVCIDVASVHGDVGATERNTIFYDFQNTDRISVLLAHPKVASHGLTLTRAKSIVWFAPIYSLEQYEQANARIRRLTTAGRTTIFHLYATPFEKELYRRLQFKKQVLANFLELVRGVNDDAE